MEIIILINNYTVSGTLDLRPLLLIIIIIISIIIMETLFGYQYSCKSYSL